MAKKNQRILAILGAAVGTGLTVFGVRRGVQWFRQRQLNQRYERQLGQNVWITEGRSQPMEQAIPATGVATSAPPRTHAEVVNSDRVGDYDDRGTAFRTTEMDTRQSPPLTGEASEGTGRMTGTNVHGDDAVTRDESFGTVEHGRAGNRAEDRGYIDTSDVSATSTMGVSPEDTGENRIATGSGVGAGTKTGMDMGTGTRSGQPTSTDTFPSGQSKDIVMDEVVMPLIEHAIAFNSVMNLLRSRQRDGVGNEGVESLTEGDRNSMRAVLDQMQEKVVDYDETAMRKNPLAHRSYKLTQKLRDALDNLNYTGSDLYRLNDEIKKELCILARELENSGQVTITGLDQIRQLYEC